MTIAQTIARPGTDRDADYRAGLAASKPPLWMEGGRSLHQRYARGIVSSVWNLKLAFVDADNVDTDRANAIIEKLRTQRPVQGDAPEWKVAFEDVSQQRAFEELEQALTAIDEGWGEVVMAYAA
jgi:hypothetical protein